MRLLTVVTRVCEYIPEMIAFIEKIVGNGYANESNSSVNFDDAEFSASPHHRYNKLEPGAASDANRVNYGEGVSSPTGSLLPLRSAACETALCGTIKRGRTNEGLSGGRGQSRLAYRMLCDGGHSASEPADGRPQRRCRPKFLSP